MYLIQRPLLCVQLEVAVRPAAFQARGLVACQDLPPDALVLGEDYLLWPGSCGGTAARRPQLVQEPDEDSLGFDMILNKRPIQTRGFLIAFLHDFLVIVTSLNDLQYYRLEAKRLVAEVHVGVCAGPVMQKAYQCFFLAFEGHSLARGRQGLWPSIPGGHVMDFTWEGSMALTTQTVFQLDSFSSAIP